MQQIDALSFQQIYGIPVPKELEKYITLDALQASVKGSGKVAVHGEYKGCERKTIWSGDASVAINCTIAAEAKAKLKRILVVKARAEAKTTVTEEIKAENDGLTVSGAWNGLQVNGTFIVMARNNQIVSGSISETVIQPDQISPFTVRLPNLIQ